MNIRSLSFGTILLLLCLGSSAAWAQGESTPPPPPPAPAAPPPPSSSSQAQTHVEHYQDWEVRCGAGAQGSTTNCEMVQTVSQKKNNKPIMRVAIGYPPKSDNPIAIFLLPLGMRLPPGVKFSIDSASPITFPVQFCVTQGCRADMPLKAELLRQLRAGTKATVVILEPRGRPISLPLSLMGFSAAFNRISH